MLKWLAFCKFQYFVRFTHLCDIWKAPKFQEILKPENMSCSEKPQQVFNTYVAKLWHDRNTYRVLWIKSEFFLERYRSHVVRRGVVVVRLERRNARSWQRRSSVSACHPVSRCPVPCITFLSRVRQVRQKRNCNPRWRDPVMPACRV